MTKALLKVGNKFPTPVFICYSHEDQALQDKLVNHLYQLQRDKSIKVWHDRHISAGREWEQEITHHLNTARIILLLISDDFLACDRCYGHMEQAIKRHEGGQATVIPIILRPVNWSGAPFGKLQILPKDGKPITSWENQDQAFVNIAEAIIKVVQQINPNPQPSSDLLIPARETKERELLTLEIPEGQVPINSPFYVERFPIERDCYETIVNPGALIRIKAPRQMGKSSLLSRILHHASQQGHSTVYLSFQDIDENQLVSLDQFLQCFCSSIADELNLADNLSDFWTGPFGSLRKCGNYFYRYLLQHQNNPLVLGLDEVDKVFPHEAIAKDFFGMLRAWHEKGKNDPNWQKLRLIIAHSKEVYIPLDMTQSPFNVGLAIELLEFTVEQVEELVTKHRLNWTNQQIQVLMQLCGGHPYLVRVALFEIAKGRITLEELLKVAPTEAGIYRDHLRRHLLNLQNNESLLNSFKKVILSAHPIQIDSSDSFKLRSMGLVKLQGNEVLPLCELYRQYFKVRLGNNR